MAAESLFHDFEKEGINVFSESLLKFTPIPFVKPNTDWIFFYSKKGVDFFFQANAYDATQKYGVMGASTGIHFTSKTQKTPDYIGNNNGSEIAIELGQILADRSITFIKAKNSISGVEKHLVSTDNRYGLAIYNNEVLSEDTIESFGIPKCEIVVLTSPKNAEAWFKFRQHTNESVFAIGETTARTIKQLVNQNVPFCKEPSEVELYNLVKAKI